MGADVSDVDLLVRLFACHLNRPVERSSSPLTYSHVPWLQSESFCRLAPDLPPPRRPPQLIRLQPHFGGPGS